MLDQLTGGGIALFDAFYPGAWRIVVRPRQDCSTRAKVPPRAYRGRPSFPDSGPPAAAPDFHFGIEALFRAQALSDVPKKGMGGDDLIVHEPGFGASLHGDPFAGFVFERGPDIRELDTLHRHAKMNTLRLSLDK